MHVRVTLGVRERERQRDREVSPLSLAEGKAKKKPKKAKAAAKKKGRAKAAKSDESEASRQRGRSKERARAGKRRRGKGQRGKSKSSEEDHSGERGRSTARGKKSKARARKDKSKSSDARSAKAKAKTKKSGKKNRRELDKNIKCSTCKKTKDSSDFHEGQARCKSCSSHARAWLRACEAQGIADKMAKLQKSDPKLYEQVMVKWIKERMKLDSVYQKVKFSIWEFVITVQQRTGLRKEVKRRMMWKEYFIQHAQKPKGGGLSEAEAQLQWTAWEKDKSHGRDWKGPRGHLRLEVPLYDDLVGFDEYAKQRELSKKEKLSSKQASSGELVDSRLKMLAGAGSSTDDMGGSKWGAIEDHMLNNQLSTDALEPDAEEMVMNEELKKKRRRSSGGGSKRAETVSSTSDDDSSGDDDEDMCGHIVQIMHAFNLRWSPCSHVHRSLSMGQAVRLCGKAQVEGWINAEGGERAKGPGQVRGHHLEPGAVSNHDTYKSVSL